MGQAAAVVVAARFARGLGVLQDEGAAGRIGNPIIAVADFDFGMIRSGTGTDGLGTAPQA